jgi:predicted nucleotidyltransferase
MSGEVLEKLKELLLFGSFARFEATEKSDIDLIVEFEKGYETFKNYMALKEFLEKNLQRSVNLIVKSTLKPSLKETIKKEVISV